MYMFLMTVDVHIEYYYHIDRIELQVKRLLFKKNSFKFNFNFKYSLIMLQNFNLFKLR